MKIFNTRTLLLLMLLGTTIGASVSLGRMGGIGAQEHPQNMSISRAYDISQYVPQGWAGYYLAGRFGQYHHDWNKASQYINEVLKTEHKDESLKKRAMILAMGSGKAEIAFSLAKENLKNDPNHSLSKVFLAAKDFKEENYEAAHLKLQSIEESGISDFIVPVLNGWASAGIDKHHTKELIDNTVHIHHAILIADYMNKHDHIQNLLEQALDNEAISSDDLKRIADLYAHIGQKEKAKELYVRSMQETPKDPDVAEKIRKINSDEDMQIFETIESPLSGAALAFFDTARTLHVEYNDDIAKIFVHLAHYLNPDTNSKLLLSEIAARHERYSEAIKYLQSISRNDARYIDAQRRAADLMLEAEDYDQALHSLQFLVDKFQDIDALVQIGDIHRHQENFKQALKAYDRAEKKIGAKIPEEYWHIYYMRGICYERLDKWDKAEKELLAALDYKPDHPFVLNYLGYAWADKGMNLKQSLEMIRKAVNLRPQDGYITDSLGWVLYRMGQFEESVPHLEKAVELLPYDPVINDHLGDSYWKVGRKLEAKFQWLRAKNHTEDTALLETIENKLSKGLIDIPVLKAAQSDAKNIQTKKQ